MKRHLILIIDYSHNYFESLNQNIEAFIMDYFDQNPISQLGIIVTHNEIAEEISEMSGLILKLIISSFTENNMNFFRKCNKTHRIVKKSQRGWGTITPKLPHLGFGQHEVFSPFIISINVSSNQPHQQHSNHVFMIQTVMIKYYHYHPAKSR